MNKSKLQSSNSTLIFWHIITIFVLFYYSDDVFMRSPDDGKELIFYGSIFIVTFLWFVKSGWNNFKNIQIEALQLLLIAYLVYSSTNILLVSNLYNEGFATLGKSWLFLMGILIFSQFSKEQLVQYLSFLVLCGGLVVLAVNHLGRVGNNFALIGHVSYLCNFLALQLPWSVYFAFVHPRKPLRFIFLINALVVAIGIVIGARRTSTLGLLFGVGTVLVLVFRYFNREEKRIILKKFLGPIFAVVSILIGAYFIAFNFFGSNIYDRSRQAIQSICNGSYQSDPRYIIVLRSWDAIQEKFLLGWGYGSFRFVYPRFVHAGDIEPRLFILQDSSWLMHPHNEILNQLFEGGLIGTILFCLPLLLFAWALLKKFKTSIQSEKYLFFPLLAGLSSELLISQFDTSAYSAVVRLALLPYLALGYQLAKDQIPHWHLSQLQIFKQPLLVILLVGFVLTGATAIGYNISSYFTRQALTEIDTTRNTQKHHASLWLSPSSFETLHAAAQIEWRLGNKTQSLNFYEKAHQLYPYVPLISFELANSYMRVKELGKANAILTEVNSLYNFYEPAQDLQKRVLKLIEKKKGGAYPQPVDK